MEHVVAGNGSIDFNSDSRVGRQKSATFRFDARHVLYGKLRPYLNKVATPAFAGRCSTELIPLLPQDGVDRAFLAHLLRRQDTVDFVMAAVTGSRMPRADMKVLLSMRVPLPPLDEQRRIVAILNRATRIERLRARAAERMREFVPALFVKMFDDPADKGMESATQKVPLGELCGLINGRAFKPTDWVDVGVPIVRIQNLRDPLKPMNKFDGEVHERFMIDSGDVLLSWSGTPGTSFGCFVWDRGPAVLNQHIFRVEYDSSIIERDFFVSAMNSKLDEMIGRAQGGVGLRHITKAELNKIKLPLPPLEAQQRFARIVRLERGVSKLAASGLEVVADLRRSLMANMLRETSHHLR
ncbi:MAG: restriction endonuclease subunit S [Gammaproteobacteria bacterium]|nr:restriction endonuclease subunit S [Gammaproteobacteria bacterium]